jgi:hypothetical protein
MKQSILLFLSIVFSTNSYAGSRDSDEILRNFTKSIAAIYTASKSCENTISPGPKEYIEIIGSYFERLYPSGVSYWVLTSSEPIVNANECIFLIERSLSEYKSAYNDYNNNYPNVGAVPILVYYKWNYIYVEPSEKKVFRSYLPSAKQKFSSN